MLLRNSVSYKLHANTSLLKSATRCTSGNRVSAEYPGHVSSFKMNLHSQSMLLSRAQSLLFGSYCAPLCAPEFRTALPKRSSSGRIYERASGLAPTLFALAKSRFIAGVASQPLASNPLSRPSSARLSLPFLWLARKLQIPPASNRLRMELGCNAAE